MTKSLQKGFTLIELLVVIAIIGILAAVVLVAINPAQRIAEANDSKTKSNVGQVATAAEACFTANAGSYAAPCNSAQAVTGANNDLIDGGYLKQAMPAVASAGGVAIVGPTSNEIVAYGILTAQSAVCATGTGSTKYLVYRSQTGATRVECLSAAPTAP